MSKDSPVYAYTDAPVEYDWGWTRTEVENIAIYDPKSRPRTLRKVRIEDEYHAKMQLGRYGSGMYLALEYPMYADWVKQGLIVENPIDEQIHHYRTSFDLPSDFQPDAEHPFYKRYEYYAYGEGKAENVTVKSDAFGGGKYNVSVHVVGDKKLFYRIIHELKAELGIA